LLIISNSRYLIEIAKIFNVEYEPDPQVMSMEQKSAGPDGILIDFDGRNNLDGGVPAPPGPGDLL
jgi:vacuolar protein sorting-associated protein IST1